MEIRKIVGLLAYPFVAIFGMPMMNVGFAMSFLVLVLFGWFLCEIGDSILAFFKKRKEMKNPGINTKVL